MLAGEKKKSGALDRVFLYRKEINRRKGHPRGSVDVYRGEGARGYNTSTKERRYSIHFCSAAKERISKEEM